MDISNINDRELVRDICDKVSGCSDMDWSEIQDKYGLDMSLSTLRHIGAGIKIAYNAGCIKYDDISYVVDNELESYHRSDSSNDAELEKIKYDNLYKLKTQFYDQRREYNKLLMEDARWNHIENELIRYASKMEPYCTNAPHKFIYDKEEKDVVIVLSDWHYGMFTDNIWNEYNTDIAKERIDQFMGECYKKMSTVNVKTAHVVILGDMISGSIHPSIRVKNSEDTVSQVMDVSEIIAWAIAFISNLAENTIVYCTFGNHGRITAKKDESIHEENLERIIPFWLKQRLKDIPTIKMCEESSISHELIDVNCRNHHVCCTHGDLESINRLSPLVLSNVFEKAFDNKMEYMITGHIHHTYTDEECGITRLVCGSLCGTDEYAKDKRLFSKPSQMLLFFDDDGLDSIHTVELKR